MTPNETDLTVTAGDSCATAPLTRTFGPQGPTLGDLSDAYLQDYQVRQFRSQSTARGRTAHLAAFFGRAARAATLTTYQIRQYQLTRRAAGAATGTINRETSALHRMGTLAVRVHLPRPVAGYPRSRLLLRLAQAGDPRPHLGRDRQGRRRHPALAGPLEDAGGADSPHLTTHRRGPGAAAGTPRPQQPARLPPRRHPRPPLAARRGAPPARRPGVPTCFLHDCRRTAARNLIRANVSERVAMLLTGHKSRAIFDRYNIIHEQELLDAGGPAGRLSGAAGAGGASPPAAPPGRPCHPAHRPAPPPRATHHRVRARGTPASREAGAGHRLSVRRRSRPAHRTGRPAIVAHVATGRADAAEHGSPEPENRRLSGLSRTSAG